MAKRQPSSRRPRPSPPAHPLLVALQDKGVSQLQLVAAVQGREHKDGRMAPPFKDPRTGKAVKPFGRISAGHLSDILTGHARPSAAMAQALVEACRQLKIRGITAEQLVFWRLGEQEPARSRRRGGSAGRVAAAEQ